jgi:hypothetical protein
MFSAIWKCKPLITQPGRLAGANLSRGAGTLPLQAKVATPLGELVQVVNSARELGGITTGTAKIHPAVDHGADHRVDIKGNNAPKAPADAPKAPADVPMATADANPVAFSGHQDEFWRNVPIWANVSAKDFLSYRWSVS